MLIDEDDFGPELLDFFPLASHDISRRPAEECLILKPRLDFCELSR